VRSPLFIPHSPNASRAISCFQVYCWPPNVGTGSASLILRDRWQARLVWSARSIPVRGLLPNTPVLMLADESFTGHCMLLYGMVKWCRFYSDFPCADLLRTTSTASLAASPLAQPPSKPPQHTSEHAEPTHPCTDTIRRTYIIFSRRDKPCRLTLPQLAAVQHALIITVGWAVQNA
jgi:hypothetical protein